MRGRNEEPLPLYFLVLTHAYTYTLMLEEEFLIFTYVNLKFPGPSSFYVTSSSYLGCLAQTVTVSLYELVPQEMFTMLISKTKWRTTAVKNWLKLRALTLEILGISLDNIFSFSTSPDYPLLRYLDQTA